MAKKCRLADIEPANDEGLWSLAAINFCTEDIVETQCHISIHDRCDSDDIFPCSITNENGEDLNSMLIAQNFARLSQLKFDPDDLCDVMDFEELFEQNKVTPSNEIDKQAVSPKNWNERFQLNDDLQIGRAFTFDNRTISTSTSIDAEISNDSIIDRIKLSFESFRMDVCTRNLVCEIMQILDPTCLIIAPESAEYESKYHEMMAELQNLASHLKPLNVFEENTKCIAYSQDDKLWKRAMILENKLDSNEIAIVFVDSLQISTSVPLVQIRTFPDKDNFMLPLKYTEAQLYGMKPNRRLRSHDVANELGRVLNATGVAKDRDRSDNPSHIVKIISLESKPQIEIYAKHQMKQVAYASLIAEGFYSKINSIPF